MPKQNPIRYKSASKSRNFSDRLLVLLSHIFRRFAAPSDLVTCRFGWAANGGENGALDAIE